MTTDALPSDAQVKRVECLFRHFEMGFGSIGLVSCSAEKLECRAPARDLYRSQLFRKTARLCEAMHMDWAILSAKHGLVLPDQVLDPYDQSLTDMGRTDRAAWSIRTHQQIVSRWGVNRAFWVCAGRGYVKAVFGGGSHLPTVILPLDRLTIGGRLKYLTDKLPMACERAINGEHTWTFRDGRGEPIPGSAVGKPTAARALERFTLLYPEGFPWETHYTTRSIPKRQEITTHRHAMTQDPVLLQRRVFAKATGLTLPREPEWLTSATPERERA